MIFIKSDIAYLRAPSINDPEPPSMNSEGHLAKGRRLRI